MPVFSKRTITIAASGGTAQSTASTWIPLSQYSEPFNVGFGVVISGSIEYRVEHTFDDVFDPNATIDVFVHEDVSAAQANADGNYAFPVAAVRLAVVSAVTSGAATLTVRQAGL